MMAAILNISEAALHVEDRAPPPPLPFAFKELTTFAKHCSVHIGTPIATTLLWAFRPPKLFSPATYTTFFSPFWVLLPELLTLAVTVAGQSIADAVAIYNPTAL